MAANPGEAGLRLIISTALVSMMGGNLLVQSIPGEGPRFHFTLPLQRGRPVAKVPAIDALRRHTAEHRVRVLAVDDLDLNLRLLHDRLVLWGLEATLTRHADEALELLATAQASGAPFDLAILDHDMPGVTGPELATVIRDDPALAATPLILLSSRLVATRLSRSGSSPFDATIGKPLRPHQLARALWAILNRDRTQAHESEDGGEPAAETKIPGVVTGRDPVTAKKTGRQASRSESIDTTPTRQRDPIGANRDMVGPDPGLDEGGLLNRDVLDELREVVGDDALAGIAGRLIDQGDAALAAIDAALAARDLTGAAAQAHSLAGGAATLGCADVSREMADLEQDLLAGAVPGAARREAMNDLWVGTRNALIEAYRRSAAE